MLSLFFAVVAGLAVAYSIYQRGIILRLRKESTTYHNRYSSMAHTLWMLENGFLTYLDQSDTVKKIRSRITDLLSKSSWGK